MRFVESILLAACTSASMYVISAGNAVELLNASMSGVSIFGRARYTITGSKGSLCSLQRFVIHIPYYVSLRTSSYWNCHWHVHDAILQHCVAPLPPAPPCLPPSCPAPPSAPFAPPPDAPPAPLPSPASPLPVPPARRRRQLSRLRLLCRGGVEYAALLLCFGLRLARCCLGGEGLVVGGLWSRGALGARR